MDWIEVVKDINYIGVLVAVVSTFGVGMFWYSESAFGKQWMKLSGLSKKDVEDKDSMKHAMLHSAIASFFSAVVLSSLMLATVTEGVVDGTIFGAVIGFGIAMSSLVTHDVFSRKPKMLTKINGLHDVVAFAVMGLIIGAFGA